jgi:hypothetical protein
MMTISMEITMATIGRLIKNFDMDYLVSANAVADGFGFT